MMLHFLDQRQPAVGLAGLLDLEVDEEVLARAVVHGRAEFLGRDRQGQRAVVGTIDHRGDQPAGTQALDRALAGLAACLCR